MHDLMERQLAKRRSGDDGFTLIELLVVVVIIGVLVAIAVPVYLNYRQGAANRSAQSDVRGAISAMEQYYTDNANEYPTSKTTATPGATIDLAGTSQLKVTTSAGTSLKIVVNVANGLYAVCAKNSGGNKAFSYNNKAGGSVAEGALTLYDSCAAPTP